MIQYENLELVDVVGAMESLAYKIFHYQNPDHYEVSDKDIVNILREEGIPAQVVDDDEEPDKIEDIKCLLSSKTYYHHKTFIEKLEKIIYS